MRSAVTLAVCLVVAPSALASGSPKKGGAHPQKAHAHGSVQLGVAVDGSTAEIELDGPAEAVFGFEHAPRTEQQKQVVTDTLKILREHPAKLFAFATDAGCTVSNVNVESAQEDAMKGQKKAAPAGHGHEHGHDHAAPESDEHAEVEARWTFTCKAALAGGKLQLALIKTFPRMQRVEVSLVSGSRQTGKTLTKDEALEL